MLFDFGSFDDVRSRFLVKKWFGFGGEMIRMSTPPKRTWYVSNGFQDLFSMVADAINMAVTCCDKADGRVMFGLLEKDALSNV